MDLVIRVHAVAALGDLGSAWAMHIWVAPYHYAFQNDLESWQAKPPRLTLAYQRTPTPLSACRRSARRCSAPHPHPPCEAALSGAALSVLSPRVKPVFKNDAHHVHQAIPRRHSAHPPRNH